jgi:hypothetical protein
MIGHTLPQRCPTTTWQSCDINTVDANLMHDVVMGTSVTGILHLVNKTPIEWYSTKQAILETATYGSEFIAACLCVEQIIVLCNMLQYLGVPIRNKCYMFGDNKSAVDSSMQLNAKLHKQHTMLSFHDFRETIRLLTRWRQPS